MRYTYPDDLYAIVFTGCRVKLQNFRVGGIELTSLGYHGGSFPRKTHLWPGNLGVRASVLYGKDMVCIIMSAKAWCRWTRAVGIGVCWLSFLTYVGDISRNMWKSKETEERRFWSLDYVRREVVSTWMKLGLNFQEKKKVLWIKKKSCPDYRYSVNFQWNHVSLIMYASWFLLFLSFL